MNKTTLIIRRTYCDDSEGTIHTDIKVCNSLKEANRDVLNDLNEGFDAECNTLAQMACLLAESGIDAQVIGSAKGDNFFSWSDNGKGEDYEIKEIDLDSRDYQKLF